MLVKVFLLDEGTSGTPLCTFRRGTHVLGRGALLKCPDKRVSRNHIELEITSDNVTITSKHPINPCFYCSVVGRTMTILKFDSPETLQSGDTFGFFPDQYWFKVELCTDSLEDSDDKQIESDKTTANSTCEEPEVKVEESTGEIKNNTSEESAIKVVPSTSRIKDEEQDISTANKTDQNCVTQKNVFNINEAETDKESDGDSPHNEEINNVAQCSSVITEIKREIASDDDNEAQSNNQLMVKVKTEYPSSDDDTKENICNSNKTQKRDRCWYPNCYRKNPDHKKKFSHPGDSDYDTDPLDSRPSCSYGLNCYRRNAMHRQDFKHPKGAHANKMVRPPKRPLQNVDESSDEDDDGINASNITTTKRPRTKVARKDESSEDDYDVDDPFIDNGSEDEYSEDPSSSDNE